MTDRFGRVGTVLRRFSVPLLGTAGLLLMPAPPAAGQDGGTDAGVVEPGPRIAIDVTGYYLMTEFGGDPAFGSILGTVGDGAVPDNFTVAQELPELDGGGVTVSLQREIAAGWFSSFVYTGFFTDESHSLGDASSDTDSVHASLLDKSLADDASLNGTFDNARVDFASESIELEQQFGDLVVGRAFAGGPLQAFWRGGLRVAHTELDRDVSFRNVEAGAGTDRADIAFRSDAWGVGPTVGGGVSAPLAPGLTLSTSASASALFSWFDLSRGDTYTDASAGRTEFRGVELDTTSVVPVFDASVELKAERGRYFASLGYTASAWLGGARSIITPGWDDSDDESSNYTIRNDDLVTHGVFARAGAKLGGGPDSFASFDGDVPAIWENVALSITGYYLMTEFGGDPAFGTITGTLSPDPDNFTISQEFPEMEGGGVTVSLQREMAAGWFSGLAYTGFFTDESHSLGDASNDSRSVFAGLIDRPLAEVAPLNTDAQRGQVDFASESIELEQQFGDLVVGRRSGGGPFQSFWHGGLRVANTQLDRDVRYQDLDAVDLDTADIAFRSEAWGVGPTVGGGVSAPLAPGLTLATSASASALYSWFDLSRGDTYTNQNVGETDFRGVSLDSSGVVPVFDTTVELKAERGRFFASLGYTASAWLGGARSIIAPGWDDSDDDTTNYTVRRDDLITHGVFARAGAKLGGDPYGFAPFNGGAPALWENVALSITGYYLMTEFGGDPAFGTITGTVDPDPDNSTVPQELPEMEGGGMTVSLQRETAAGWFSGLAYTGFFTDESHSLGDASNDTDRVHPSLLDRSLASQLSLNGDFEEGEVDFASESIELEQQFGDLVVGRRAEGGRLQRFWRGGLRVANTQLDRDVTYQNLEGANDLDTADIAFRSDAWGVGPTVGGGVSALLGPGLALATSASASALYSWFDLSRGDAYTDQSGGGTEFRGVELETTGVVPVFDASIELKAERGRFFASLGYTASAWLGGARSIITPGWDDSDDEVSNYTIRNDDLVTHGVFGRVGVKLGSVEVE